jgi:hypothetical protein
MEWFMKRSGAIMIQKDCDVIQRRWSVEIVLNRASTVLGNTIENM